MSDDLQTVSPDQISVAATPAEDAFVLIQSPGGPLQKTPYQHLLAKLIATDLVMADEATLQADIAHDQDAVALVINDADPLKNGWYRKVGATGTGDWSQFEQLASAVRDATVEVAAQAGVFAGDAAASATLAASTVASVKALRALSFGTARPIKDLTNVGGGGVALYLPRSIYRQDAASVLVNTTLAVDANSPFSTHVRMLLTAGSHNFIYYDIAAGAYASVVYASGSIPFPSGKTTDNIIPICTISISGTDSQHSFVNHCGAEWVSAEGGHNVIFNGPIIKIGLNFLIPPYYYRGENQAAFTLISPQATQGWNLLPGYHKVGVGAETTIGRIWHDERLRRASTSTFTASIAASGAMTVSAVGAASTALPQVGMCVTGTNVPVGIYVTAITSANADGTGTYQTNATAAVASTAITGVKPGFIKAISGSTQPIALTDDTWMGALLIQNFGNGAMSPWGEVIGDVHAGSEPNQYSYTRDPSTQPGLWLYNTTAIVAVTDATATAYGVSKGIKDTANGIPAIDLPLSDIRGNGQCFVRVMAIADAAGGLPAAINAAWYNTDKSQHVTTALALEDQLSTTVAFYSGVIPMTDRTDMAYIRVSPSTANTALTLAHFQIHNGRFPRWVRRADKPTLPTNEKRLTDVEARATALESAASSSVAVSAIPSGNLPILSSDGRFLKRWRSAVAAWRLDTTKKLRIGIAGDSWAEQTRIPYRLRAVLAAKYGGGALPGPGWISVANVNDGSEVGVLTSSGWTAYDVTGSLTVGPSYGCGPDGASIFTTTDTATWSVSAARATDLRVYYQDLTGRFQILIDDVQVGADVVGGGTGNLAYRDLTGLTDANHKISITTTGNTGTVAIHGMRAERSGIGGVVRYKLGNGGAEGGHYSLIDGYIAPYSADLNLDALVIILGTNDYRNSKGTASYIQGLTELIAAHRSSNATLPVLLVMPAQCDPTPNTPSPALSAYRDALLTFARTNGYDYVSLFDSFDTYAIENARGNWFDLLHLSDQGAWRAVSDFAQPHLLGVLP